ncbi:hypothetical protein imdm_2263 [gamma proteobacterium IMCC2047]|nr:hypothetical protein imdm_2263 [gamma proteobacterium IMCC2047]
MRQLNQLSNLPLSLNCLKPAILCGFFVGEKRLKSAGHVIQ